MIDILGLLKGARYFYDLNADGVWEYAVKLDEAIKILEDAESLKGWSVDSAPNGEWVLYTGDRQHVADFPVHFLVWSAE